MTRTSASAALSVLLFATALGAQSSDRQRDDSRLRNALADIASQPRRAVRVSTYATGRLQGNHISLLGDSVHIDTDAGARSVAITDVDSVWTHRGTAALLVGILTGFPCAILGATIGGFIGGDPDSKGTPRKEAIYTIVGFAGGALVCGGVGALVGSSFDRWRLEFARSQGPPLDPMHTMSCDTSPMKPLGRAVKIPDAVSREGFASLTGAVVQDETGDAIGGAVVRLRPSDTTNAAPIWRHTDSKGGFTFDNLAAQSYDVQVMRVGENIRTLTVNPARARVDTIVVRMKAFRCYGY